MFVQEVKEEIESMNKTLNEAVEVFEKTAAFLGEDEKKVQPEEVFGMLYMLQERMNNAIKELENHKVESEKQVKREAAKLKRVSFR